MLIKHIHSLAKAWFPGWFEYDYFMSLEQRNIFLLFFLIKNLSAFEIRFRWELLRDASVWTVFFLPIIQKVAWFFSTATLCTSVQMSCFLSPLSIPLAFCTQADRRKWQELGQRVDVYVITIATNVDTPENNHTSHTKTLENKLDTGWMQT